MSALAPSRRSRASGAALRDFTFYLKFSLRIYWKSKFNNETSGKYKKRIALMIP
jgi:hypothetical protein